MPAEHEGRSVWSRRRGSSEQRSDAPTRDGDASAPADPRMWAWATALGLTLLVAVYPQFALGTLAPQLRDDLGIGPLGLGLLFVSFYVVAAAGSPLAGPIVDRIGGRRGCVTCLLIAALAMMAASLATSPGGLGLALLPAGAAVAMANPATTRWALSADSADRQGALVGFAQAGTQAGALVAGALGAASALGLEWRGSLRIIAAVALLSAVLARWGPDDRVTAAQRPFSGGRSGGRAATMEDGGRRYRRRLLVYAALMGVGSSVVLAHLPSYAVDDVRLGVVAAGATASLYGGVALICRLALGPILRYTGGVDGVLPVLPIGAAVAIGSIAAGALSPSLMWIGTILFGVTGMTWQAVAFLAAGRAAAPGGSGRATGVLAAVFISGLLVGPPVAGLLIDVWGYGLAWLLAGSCSVLALAPMVRIRSPRS